VLSFDRLASGRKVQGQGQLMITPSNVMFWSLEGVAKLANSALAKLIISMRAHACLLLYGI